MTHSDRPKIARSAATRARRAVFLVLFAALGALVGCGTILGIEPGVFTGEQDSGSAMEAEAFDAPADAGPRPEADSAPDAMLDVDAEAGSPGDASPVGPTLALGQNHACALFVDGAVDCWGDNSSGQLGVGDAAVDGDLPTRVPGLGHVVALSAGPDATHQCAALEDGAVECWGNNEYGQVLGYASADDEVGVPTVVQGLPGRVGALAAGTNHTCALLVDHPEVWCWGDWSDTVSAPTLVQTLAPPVTSLSAAVATCAVTGVGGECWGLDNSLTLGSPDAGAGSNGDAIQPQGLGDAGQIVLGYTHGCALVNGRVLCWGSDDQGDTGEDPEGADGAFLDLGTPTQVPGLATDVIEIAASLYSSCALRADGDVWCWGELTNGYVPVQVSLVGPATHIFGGGHFACALVGGAPYCWGYDTYGQLGNGEVSDGLVPVTKVDL
jgi:Regulator of chromosome condensation (RCC1) repeat